MKDLLDRLEGNRTYACVFVALAYYLGAKYGLWARSDEIEALLMGAAAIFLRASITNVQTNKTNEPK